MLPEEAAQLLASCEEVHVGSMEDLEAFLLQCKVDVDPSQSDTQPKQDQASGSQQEAGAQSANGQSADPPKPAGGNGKKKKNRKKGGPKAPPGGAADRPGHHGERPRARRSPRRAGPPSLPPA